MIRVMSEEHAVFRMGMSELDRVARSQKPDFLRSRHVDTVTRKPAAIAGSVSSSR